MKKRMMEFTALFLIAGMFAGCGGKASSDMAFSETATSSSAYNGAAYDSYSDGLAGTYDSYDYGAGEVMEEAADAEMDEMAAAEEGTTRTLDSMTLLEEKLVYHCDMEIETTEYADTMSAIKNTIEKYDGIIQGENETDSSYNWYYEDYYKTSGTMYNYLQIRIPSANYDAFLQEIDGVGKIVSKSTSVDNISQTYYDTTVEIKALETQEEKLLSMLENCETIEDMITVEERLTEVQYQLGKLKTNLRYMDVDVAYSYVNISVEEVMEYHYEEPMKKNTFLNRLQDTFTDTWKGFLRFLEGLLFCIIRLIPYIILGTVLWLLLRKPVKKWRQKRREKKAAKMEKRENG